MPLLLCAFKTAHHNGFCGETNAPIAVHTCEGGNGLACTVFGHGKINRLCAALQLICRRALWRAIAFRLFSRPAPFRDSAVLFVFVRCAPALIVALLSVKKNYFTKNVLLRLFAHVNQFKRHHKRIAVCTVRASVWSKQLHFLP